MQAWIDLRSDTVTKPCKRMREAIANAEVGDDVYGEDPTVRALEEHVADLLGKEAAMFVPSGSMGNQICIALHTRPGDEMIIAQASHVASFESGAASALSGVQAVAIGADGMFSTEQLEDAVRSGDPWYPRTSLVSLENTHNHAGGRVWPMDALVSVTNRARSLGLRLHLDGARLWNAAAALGVAEREIAQHFDTVNVCFSKGLGAPVGSAVCGSAKLIEEARRLRKRFGGGMRQSGIVAAATLFALQNNRSRLLTDHENARHIARVLWEVPAARVQRKVETNILIVDTPTIESNLVVAEAKARGLLVSSFGPRRIRIVTHKDMENEADRAARILADVIGDLGETVRG